MARGSSFENYKYCTKDGKFTVFGDWDKIIKYAKKSNQCGNQISLPLIIEALIEDPDSDVKNTGQYLRHKVNIDNRVAEIREHTIAYERFKILSDTKLRHWQYLLLTKLDAQNDREILWVVDEEGGKGKTFMSNVLQFVFGYLVLDGVSKTSDI